MEALFAQEYGLSAKDIVEMSWRRFRVLLEHVITRGDQTGEAGEFDINAAFDRAQGKEPATYNTVSLAEFQGMM